MTDPGRGGTGGSDPRLRPGAALLALGVLISASVACPPRLSTPRVEQARAGAMRPVMASASFAALLDPAFSLGAPPALLSDSAPLNARFALAVPQIVAAAGGPDPSPSASDQADAGVPDGASDATAPAEVPADAVLPLPRPTSVPVVAQMVESVPLPTPRPPDAVAVPLGPGPSRAPFRRFAHQGRRLASAPVVTDNRNFFQKLFGLQQPAGPALAYAAPESNLFGRAQSPLSSPMISNPFAANDGATAVYNIAAHTVTLPNGTRLEAHSGLGNRLDDPRYVHERNRGATPPHVYELQPREALFHGVAALRLTPVGGGSVYGRNGLLAHTYMLGPNGDSNGCVSFQNYNAFLQAFRNGEVRRLAVVAGL